MTYIILFMSSKRHVGDLGNVNETTNGKITEIVYDVGSGLVGALNILDKAIVVSGYCTLFPLWLRPPKPSSLSFLFFYFIDANLIEPYSGFL